MKKYLILIAPCLFLLSGCAIFSSTITFTPVDGLSDVKISSRTAPAKISKESDKALEAQGYAYIGFARSEDIVKTCWDKDCDNFTCTDNLPHRDTTKEILEKAASHGGDLVILQTDSVLSINRTTKMGSCTRTETTIYYEEACSGGYGSIRRECKSVQKMKHTCKSWSTISGMECKFLSAGTVWRQDPELIRALAKIREKNFPRNFEVMKKTYEANIPKALKERISLHGPSAIKVGDKYGFQEAVWSKKIIIAPQYTAVLHGFSEGLAAVAIGEKDKKLWGFIDNTGQWVIRPSYGDASKFYEGLASVKENNKYGYIDKKGNFIIKPQFDAAYSFIEGIAKVKDGNKEGYVNKTGEIFMEP